MHKKPSWESKVFKSTLERSEFKRNESIVDKAWDLAIEKFGTYNTNEELLASRVRRSKSKTLNEIHGLESHQPTSEEEFSILNQDKNSKNYPSGDTEKELNIIIGMRYDALNQDKAEKLRSANELRELLNLEPNLQFNVDLSEVVYKNIGKYPYKELKELQTIFEKGLNEYPFEMTMYYTLVDIYKTNLNYDPLIVLLNDLIGKMSDPSSKFTFRNENGNLNQVELDSFINKFSSELIEAYEFNGDFISALTICQQSSLLWSWDLFFKLKIKKYLFKLGMDNELLEILESEKKENKTLFLNWGETLADVDNDRFAGLFEYVNEYPDGINAVFIKIILKDLDLDLKMLYIRFKFMRPKDTQQKLNEDYFKVTNKLVECEKLLKSKQIEVVHKFDIIFDRLYLAYLSIGLGEYNSALTLYNSIDPKQYFDNTVNQSGNTEEDKKEEGENNNGTLNVNLPFPATINSLLFYRFLTH